MLGLSMGINENDLMSVVSDPAVFAERLQALTVKSAEANRFLEEARSANQNMEFSRKQAEEIKASTVALLRQIHDKDTNLVERETVLVNRQAQLADALVAFDAKQAAFDGYKKSVEDGLAKRAAALKISEEELAKRIVQHEEDNNRYVAEKTAQLEATYKVQLDSLVTSEKEISNKHETAKQLHVAAEKQKAFFEAKLVELKKLLE